MFFLGITIGIPYVLKHPVSIWVFPQKVSPFWNYLLTEIEFKHIEIQLHYDLEIYLKKKRFGDIVLEEKFHPKHNKFNFTPFVIYPTKYS